MSPEAPRARGVLVHIRILLAAAALAAAPIAADAQWIHHPTAGLPRTADGQPQLNAPAPRTSHDHPDLSGVWQAEGAPIPDLLKMVPGGQNGLGEDVPSKYFLN